MKSFLDDGSEDGGEDGGDDGADDWTKVTKDVKIAADLQENQLLIKTGAEATVGSGKQLYLYFYRGEYGLSGGLILWFWNPIKYWIPFCKSEYNPLPVTPPSDEEKVWSIAKVGTILQVECNGVMVLEYDTSVCKNYYGEHWESEIKTVEFDYSDDLSDYYQIIPQGKETIS